MLTHENIVVNLLQFHEIEGLAFASVSTVTQQQGKNTICCGSLSWLLMGTTYSYFSGPKADLAIAILPHLRLYAVHDALCLEGPRIDYVVWTIRFGRVLPSHSGSSSRAFSSSTTNHAWIGKAPHGGSIRFIEHENHH